MWAAHAFSSTISMVISPELPCLTLSLSYIFNQELYPARQVSFAPTPIFIGDLSVSKRLSAVHEIVSFLYIYLTVFCHSGLVFLTIFASVLTHASQMYSSTMSTTCEWDLSFSSDRNLRPHEL